MDLSVKNKVIIFIVYTVLIFAAGRYALPESIKKEAVKTTVVDNTQTVKENTKENVDKNKRVETTITQVVSPTGEKKTTIVKVEDTSDKTTSQVIKNDNLITKEADTSKDTSETTFTKSKVTIYGGVALLPGQSITNFSYDFGAYKPVLGPIGIGGQIIFTPANSSFGGELNVGVSF